MKKLLTTCLVALTATVSLNATPWLPEKVNTYSIGETNNWILASTTTYEYDEEGRVLSESTANGWRYEYTYNQAGSVATKTSLMPEGAGYRPYFRNVYKYDDRVPTFIIEDSSEQWNGKAWTILGISKTDIERDADGNVTALYGDSMYDPEYGWEGKYCLYTVDYTDGVASRINVFDYYDDSEPMYVYDNIKWENTDGQILMKNISVNNTGFYRGTNRLQSAEVTGIVDEPLYVTAHYKDADRPNEDYSMTGVAGDVTYYEQNYEVLDENGSYDYFNKATMMYYGSMSTTTAHDVITLDAFGIVTASERTSMTQYSPDEEPYGGTTYLRTDVKLDETGLPVETVTERSVDGDFWTMYEKKEYSDFFIPTVGIENIEITPADNEVVYYDLTGRRVSNPARGLYIRVAGATVTKVAR